MNQAKHTIDLSFGQIKIIDFPKVATSFFDFPDGRLLVNRPYTKEDRDRNQGKREMDALVELANAGEIIHYQLDLNAKQKNARMRVRKEVLDEYVEEMREALKKYVLDTRGDSVVIHSGIKNVEKLLLWILSPNSITRRAGSMQLIQGISGTDRELGTNKFELHFPRGIKCTIRGTRTKTTARSYVDFTGCLRFAKKDYIFTVEANNRAWNNYGVAVCDLKDEQKVRAYHQNMHRMVGVISRECVAEQITKMLWHAFPFILEYDMLEGFVLDPLMSLDEHMENRKASLDTGVVRI